MANFALSKFTIIKFKDSSFVVLSIPIHVLKWFCHFLGLSVEIFSKFISCVSSEIGQCFKLPTIGCIWPSLLSSCTEDQLAKVKAKVVFPPVLLRIIEYERSGNLFWFSDCLNWANFDHQGVYQDKLCVSVCLVSRYGFECFCRLCWTNCKSTNCFSLRHKMQQKPLLR